MASTSSTETVTSSLNSSVEEDDEPASKDGENSDYKERRELLGTRLKNYKQ